MHKLRVLPLLFLISHMNSCFCLAILSIFIRSPEQFLNQIDKKKKKEKLSNMFSSHNYIFSN